MLCLHLEVLMALMMEAASTFEMSVNFYQTAQHIIPEYGDFQTTLFFMSSNLKSVMFHGKY
jgi:hypothetical protein